MIHFYWGVQTTPNPSGIDVPGVANSSPPLRHFFESCVAWASKAVLPERNDTEMGAANSLQTSAYYSEYNKRFGLNKPIFIIQYRKKITKFLKSYNVLFAFAALAIDKTSRQDNFSQSKSEIVSI